MPGHKRKSYNLAKSEQLHRKRAEQAKRGEQAAKRAHAAERGASSYLSEDEQLASWKLHLNKMGLELRDIPGDGNCLFRALADQLDGNSQNHLRYRAEVCKYMTDRREDFAPFLDDTDVSFDKYVVNLSKPGTFAGNDSLVAFARLKQVTIVVHQLDMASFSIDCCENSTPSAELHLTYHHGEHYSSIRRVGDRSSSPARIKFSRAQKNQNNELDLITHGTGCEDKEFIEQSLKECGGDVDAAIDYINSLSLADKGDSSSCGSVSSCAYHSELSRRAGSTSTIDSGICTCDSVSSQNNSLTESSQSNSMPRVKIEQPKPISAKAQQSTKKLSKLDRKKEKRKRAEERHKAINDKTESKPPPEVYEVVSQVTLLSV